MIYILSNNAEIIDFSQKLKKKNEKIIFKTSSGHNVTVDLTQSDDDNEQVMFDS